MECVVWTVKMLLYAYPKKELVIQIQSSQRVSTVYIDVETKCTITNRTNHLHDVGLYNFTLCTLISI